MDYDMTIHHNPDAQAWAKFFIETTKDMERDVFRDEGYMITWFANAMMAMHDHLYVTEIVRRQNEAANEIERLREKCKNIMLLLKDCDEHLDYCGYGDSWERSMAYEKDLPNRLEAALKEKE